MTARAIPRGALLGLLAAATFGVSAPLAKALLDDADPQLLAGQLYAGAAVALGSASALRPRTTESPIRRADLPRLGLVTLSGGVVAPVLLLVGLDRLSGLTGSLLLNLEGPFTALLAVAVFGEYLGRRTAMAGALIVLGAAFLGASGDHVGGEVLGVVLIAGACGCWALDNNLTAQLTIRDPLAVVRTKAASAAMANLGMAVLRGVNRPSWWTELGAVALGAMSCGISVLLDAHALRLVGAAREAALFATAPFAGALLAVPLLGDRPQPVAGVGIAAMVAGTALLLREQHEHRHVHDEHHDHEHPPDIGADEPHSHAHRHRPVAHRHPHASDVHHRHRHD
jgi:drug/metabolite transporter (DMT)-like permease